MKTYELTVKGLVQGVGYRPYVAEMLRGLGLKGTVRNTGGIVKICITAAKEAVDELFHRLYKYYPEGARIDNIQVSEIPYREFADVEITDSDGEETVPLLPVDICICDKCAEEMKDRNNRRYRYPFISCSACGPRYTIMHRIPYDRKNTTMNVFDMCKKCKEEYYAHGDRRYYAQTISCPDCGPKLYLEIPKEDYSTDKVRFNASAFDKAVHLLREGQVLAVKNTGGYHLVCDAFSEKAVAKLREIKKRDKKPFAVMTADAVKAEKYAEISEKEKELLTGPAKPVVLLKRKKAEVEPVFQVSMESSYIGLILPSNGLQIMLAEEFKLLVMTSANISGEPMITDDEEIKKLGVPVLGNNREILSPVDDSVVRVCAGEIQVLRRGRGYVPMPVEMKETLLWQQKTFAAGADMKSAFAYGAGNRIYLSQYMGDLSHKRVQQEYLKTKKRFQNCFNLEDGAVISDKHPMYFSGKLAADKAFQGNFEKADDLVKSVNPAVRRVNHHFSHVAAVMAEHGLTDNVIGFSFDGAGYGEDGTVWGGEVCLYKEGKFLRAGHLKSVTMTGGDEGARNGRYALAGYLYNLLKIKGETEVLKVLGVELFEKYFHSFENDMIFRVIDSEINTITQSSAGRLFDAVATLLGVCDYNGYEGQCPCELEYAAYKAESVYPLKLNNCISEDGKLIADTPDLILQILKAYGLGVDKFSLAAGFHEALAEWVVECVNVLESRAGFPNGGKESSRVVAEKQASVVLAGGTFVNRMLTELCVEKLNELGAKVYISRQFPPGDDGIAAGQLYQTILCSDLEE